jgi:hypothetical protein
MTVSTGGIAAEGFGDEEMMGADEELDLGGGGLDDVGDLDDDLGGDDLGGLDLGEEDPGAEDLQEVDMNKARRLLDEVESGEKSADQAMEELSGGGDLPADDLGGDELDLGDELADEGPGLEDEGPGLEDEGLDLGGDEGSFGECYESVQRIASMLTDDPDIFRS